jgi:hypothetical protein
VRVCPWYHCSHCQYMFVFVFFVVYGPAHASVHAIIVAIAELCILGLYMCKCVLLYCCSHCLAEFIFVCVVCLWACTYALLSYVCLCYIYVGLHASTCYTPHFADSLQTGTVVRCSYMKMGHTIVYSSAAAAVHWAGVDCKWVFHRWALDGHNRDILSYLLSLILPLPHSMSLASNIIQIQNSLRHLDLHVVFPQSQLPLIILSLSCPAYVLVPTQKSSTQTFR